MVLRRFYSELLCKTVKEGSSNWICSNSSLTKNHNVYPRVPFLGYTHSSSSTTKIDNFQHVDEDSQTPDRGIFLARQKPTEEPSCLFQTLKQLGMTTTNRTHTISSSCDTVTRFIKMGIINKNMVLQYCHYVNELARTAEGSELEYYENKSIELMTYLLRNNRELTTSSITQLVADVADVSSKNCTLVCDKILDEYNLLEKLTSRLYSKILLACYKFELWDQANKLLNRDGCDFNLCLIDPMIVAMKQSTSAFGRSALGDEEKRKRKEAIMSHLFKFIEGSQKFRTQFVTKYSEHLIESLNDLGVKIVKNPTIKLSGRCTGCGSSIPLYDESSLTELNAAIKNVLLEKVKNKKNKFYLHSSSNDLKNFEVFLKDLTKDQDKPIDCVLDGLNIAYRNTIGLYYVQQAISEDFSRSVKRQNSEAMGRILANTILRSELIKNYKKILVIGREHMRNWPGLIDFFEKQKIHYYLSKGNSNDDLFSLYAATLHPKTILLSSDFFRDHLAQLELDKRILLERWIDTHQSWVYYRNLTNILPTPYEKIPSVDRKSGQFHIPVIDYHKLDSIAKHEPPPHLNRKMTTWLCCKNETE